MTGLAQIQPSAALVPIRRADVRECWDEVWPLIQPAVALGGLHTEASVLGCLIDSEMQLWVAEVDGAPAMALVTEVAGYPARSICVLLFAGGTRLDQCKPLLTAVEQWAREQGCDRMVVSGRRGWVRTLPGYQEAETMVVKDFSQ
jgi:hypothetical protein